MYKRSVTERRRFPHRHESVVKTLMKATAMALGMSSLLCGGAAFAEAPDRDEVQIKDLKWAGSGCPAGSVVSVVTPDSFNLAFAEYEAFVEPGSEIEDSRKNCHLILSLSFPPGWQFTVFEVDYRGFADLDDKVTGAHRSAYFFTGQFPSAASQVTFVGPKWENYEIRDTVAALVWSPCSGQKRALNINTEIRVSNRKNKRGSGYMKTDSITGVVEHEHFFKWRRCHKG